MPDAFPADAFQSHSAKDEVVVRLMVPPKGQQKVANFPRKVANRRRLFANFRRAFTTGDDWSRTFAARSLQATIGR